MSRQLMRFILVGGLNTVITMALFYVLSPLLGYALAYTLVYLFGISIAYFLNAHFVFKVSRNWKSAAIYPIIYLIIYLYGLVILALMVDYFGLDAMLALTFVIVSSVPINFLMSRLLFTRISGR